MTKKKSATNTPAPIEGKPVIPPGAAYPGAALMLVGFASFYFSGQMHPGMFTWHSYVSIGVLIVGGLIWFTSGMDKEHLLEWIRSALIALFLALTIRWALVEPYRIPSGSMEPTLHGDPGFGKGDRVFVNKWVYGLRYPFMNKRIWNGSAPRRWDVVVFKSVEEDAVHNTLVKRIVGMPGEHLQLRNGRVYANGEPLDLPPDMPRDLYYTSPLSAPYGVQEADAFSNIPEGHYLVLGDNSAHSRDGRYFGWLPNENIVGRVSCIWWPPGSWRDFTGFSSTAWWKTLVGIVLFLAALRLLAGRLCSVQVLPDKAQADHLVVSFLHYGPHVPFLKTSPFHWRKPARGDLVLYSAVNNEMKGYVLLVGRIAGLPGEQISFTNGVLTVNGTHTPLPYTAPELYATASPQAVFGRGKSKEYCSVPQDHYFILSDAAGDGEAASDSRCLGWVPEKQVLGRALCCWWPLQRRGRR